MKLNLSRLESHIFSCLKKHVAEAVLGLCFFVIFVLSDNTSKKEDIELLTNTMLLFPLFFALTYTCNRFFGSRLRLLYYLSLLFFVPALFINLEHFVFSVSYAFALLSAFFLLLISGGRRDNIAFAKGSIQTIIHLIISLFIGHIMELAVCAIIGSLIYIFNLDLNDWFQYTYFFILFLVVPLIFCHLQDMERFKKMPRFMDIIITYILSPAIIVYTGILYVYFITIVVYWELPKGKIGYMVLAFVLFALGGRMAQLIVTRRYYDRFYNYFSYIAIPPLIIFWIGTTERITAYGLTTSRVYLLAAGLLMTLYIFLLMSKRWGNYYTMLVVSTLCITVLTYIPGISAKSIGIYAQEKRLKEYINKLDALDSRTLKLKNNLEELFSAENKDMRELYESYHYLRKERGEEYVTEKYGNCNISPFSDYNWTYISMEEKTDITGYTYYQPFNYNEINVEVEKGVLKITHTKDGEIIMECNMDKRLNARPELLSGENNREKQELFSLKNERYMVILDNITLEKTSNGYHCHHVSVSGIFSKE